LVVVAFALSGCGHTRQVAAGRTVDMSVSEYRLNPQSVRTSTGVLSLVVHNDGILTHNLVVSTGGEEVAGTKPIPPGQTVELALNLAPGKYLMASTLLSDQTLGAYGTLTVS
jgi:hypothetical protein